MPGVVALSFEREPYFFKASSIEGENHATIVSHSEEDSGKVVAIGSRSSRLYWLSGHLNQIGYFSQMRIAKGFRGSLDRLMAGWEKMHDLHQEFGDTKSYIVSVLEDNVRARKLLTSGLSKIPIHKEIGRLNTFIFPLVSRKVKSKNYHVRKATLQDKERIVELLQKNYQEKAFAPYWSAENLFHPETQLNPEDFLLAYEKNNLKEPIGCLAVWDQRGFKQVYVQDYERKIKMLRPFLNLVRRWTGFPYFPEIGAEFSNAYLSHFALEKQHTEALVLMVQAAITESKGRGFHYLSLGLWDGTEFSNIIKKSFKPFTINSIVYLAYWPEDELKVNLIQNEDAHIEIAIL